MPLPPPAPRKQSHTRIIDCRSYEREDGYWDIEGHLSDRKTFDQPRRGGKVTLKAGDPIHDMWIRLTIDLDMLIHDVVAVSDATPYTGCGRITPDYAALEGRTIRRGWTKELRGVIGGLHGCTHLWELLGRVAVIAYQGTNFARAKARPVKPGQAAPYQFNSCHMYTPTSLATYERWPHLYTGPVPAPGEPIDP